MSCVIATPPDTGQAQHVKQNTYSVIKNLVLPEFRTLSVPMPANKTLGPTQHRTQVPRGVGFR
uniref:Uncharacterized protein n=1 Tax=Anguilla anguilla TaxID=7936 RepID=A0A0E9PBE6_ANGAN